jgi:hypothetical protein
MNEFNFSGRSDADGWAWRQSPDQEGCSYRDGWAIIIPDKRTGRVKALGDMVFPTMEGANTTAGRLAPGVCAIRPVREIWHRSKFKNSLRQQRTIIIKEATVAENS